MSSMMRIIDSNERIIDLNKRKNRYPVLGEKLEAINSKIKLNVRSSYQILSR